VLYATTGREAEARAEFERFAARGFASIRRNVLWTGVMTNLAAACALLGDARRAAELYPLLKPRAGQLLAPLVVCLGSVDRSLGQLATTLERWEDAERHFRDALDLNTRMHQWLHVAFTQADYVRMLTARNNPDDRAQIDLLLADTGTLIERVGLRDAVVAGQVQLPERREVGSHGPVMHGGAPAMNECVFQKEGDCWAIGYQGHVARLKHRKGFEYLVQLLRAPEREFAAFDLAIGQGDSAVHAGSSAGLGAESQRAAYGDTGPALDRTARDQYRRRRAELQVELAEAERMNDPLRASRLREEIALLAQQLASAMGLGGQHRRSGSAAERSRTTVTKGIRGAIRMIGQADTALGRYLATHVRTGYLCVYVPDSEHPVSFRL